MAGRQATGLPALDQSLDLEGNGVPTAVAATYVGQRYWRLDGGAGTRLYLATAVGAPGTWAAVSGV